MKLLFLTASIFLLSSTSWANTTFFSDVQSFKNNTATDLVLDTFQSAVSDNNNSVRFSNGTVTASSNIVTTTGGFTPGLRIATFVDQVGDSTFTFDSPISAFGIEILSFGTKGSPVTLSARTSSSQSSVVVEDFVGEDFNTIFLGIISDQRFNSVTFNSTEVFTFIRFDNLLTTSTIPEPATWLMMLFGFAATGFALKRRRRALA
jgi:hypothetical protein